MDKLLNRDIIYDPLVTQHEKDIVDLMVKNISDNTIYEKKMKEENTNISKVILFRQLIVRCKKIQRDLELLS